MDSIVIRSKCLWIVVFIMSFVCQGTFSDMGKISSASLQNHFSTSIGGSPFATKNNTKVITQKGGLAILPCAVKWNSPATVSWIRRRDFQLLTVGLSTHSSDARFLVEHTRHMGHWSLRIKAVREEDRGLYECQLSVYPTQSIFVELKVVEAIAEITGAPDLHIDEGSTLRLECKLKRATENPEYVFWYHNNKMVNYDSQGGFSVTSTQPVNSISSSSQHHHSGHNHSPLSSATIDAVAQLTQNYTGSPIQMAALSAVPQQQFYLITPSSSILSIKEVHFHHAGNYTCAPSNTRPASITVHVLQGEKPAAMQHANRSSIPLIDDGGKSKSTSIHCKYQQHLLQYEFLGQPIWFLAIISLICTFHKINR